MSEDVNWDLCIICQTETKHPLKCPSKSNGATNESVLKVYKDFLDNLRRLAVVVEKIDLPFSPNIGAEILREQNAS